MIGNITKILIVSFIMICAVSFFSCTGENAKELYNTAQFEELQKNTVHANELYEEIIKKYPESEYAEKAREKLKKR